MRDIERKHAEQHDGEDAEGAVSHKHETVGAIAMPGSSGRFHVLISGFADKDYLARLAPSKLVRPIAFQEPLGMTRFLVRCFHDDT